MDERMPYLGPACGTLTTASNPVLTWWGTIVTTAECAGYFPAAYLPASGPYGKIFYLMREGPLAL